MKTPSTCRRALVKANCLRRRCGRWALPAILGGALLSAQAAPTTGRLLFDDYYQKPRPEGLFGQGVAREAELRDLTNFYAPDATAIPNGTFVVTELIADTFRVEVSRQPLSEQLLEGVAAYLLVCPVREEFGGRANLTVNEADLLETFVARGGSLILVSNSVPEPEKSGLDLAGLNLVAGKFGLRFLATQTDTISIPIANDHPLFDGVPSLIYGNGNTLEVSPEAQAATEVLLESHSARAPGPVATLTRHGRGRVLLFGDAGTFGNAHAFRGDTGQALGLQQLFQGLLPDGPAPRYGWREGMRLRVEVKQEQILSGYPEFMRIFDLPRPSGTVRLSSGMRQVDLEAAGTRPERAGSRDFVSLISEQKAQFTLAIGEWDDRAHAVVWHGRDSTLPARLLPNGRIVDPEMPVGADLVAWQGLLLNEVLGAPLRGHAQPGGEWTAPVLTGLPQVQLALSPKWVSVPAEFTFEGESSLEGTPCYVFKRVTRLEGKDWSPSDLVSPEYAMQFQSPEIEILAGGQLAVARYWITQDTLLPRRTEVRVSSALWWQDPRFPSRYLGTHDSKNYENWATINFNITAGRVLTADFAVE